MVKNKEAQSLVGLRWKNTTPEQRREHALKMVDGKRKKKKVKSHSGSFAKRITK